MTHKLNNIEVKIIETLDDEHVVCETADGKKLYCNPVILVKI